MKHYVAHHNVAMDQIYAGRKNFNLRTKLREISSNPCITGIHTPNWLLPLWVSFIKTFCLLFVFLRHFFSGGYFVFPLSVIWKSRRPCLKGLSHSNCSEFLEEYSRCRSRLFCFSFGKNVCKSGPGRCTRAVITHCSLGQRGGRGEGGQAY